MSLLKTDGTKMSMEEISDLLILDSDNGQNEVLPLAGGSLQDVVGPPRYWKVPPEIYAELDSEFHFDFDPCPVPRPDGYNSLVVPWGRSNYVNPPFNKKDAPHGGPAAFVRKAIAERDRGNTSVFILPLPWNLGLLMAAGAELRYGGIIRWLEVETGKPCPRRAPQVIAILAAQQSSSRCRHE